MLTDADIDALVERVVGGAEEKLAAEVTDRLIDGLKDGVLSYNGVTDLAQLAKANSDALTDALLRHRGAISAEAYSNAMKALTKADRGLCASLAANHAPTAFASGMSAHFQAISAQAAQGVADMMTRQNLAMTQQMEALWLEVAGEAVTGVAHGLVTREEALRRAIEKLMGAGIVTIDYKSGLRSQLDTAIKRHLRTQVSQAGGRMTMERMKEWGQDLVAVSAHFGARPEHEVWQGKAYSLSGRQVIDGIEYPDFYAVTEYGEVTGLKGVNCLHYFYPYYPGITTLQSVPETREGMTSDEWYAARQKQHRMEAEVRRLKREVYGLERAGLDATDKRLALAHQQRRIQSYTASTGLPRSYADEKAWGIGAQPRGLRKATTSANVKAANADSRLRKGITIDDFTDAAYGRGIDPKAIETIYKTLKPGEIAGSYFIDSVRFDKLGNIKGHTVFMQVEPTTFKGGSTAKLIINEDAFTGTTKAQLDARTKASTLSVANSLEDAAMHEAGHMKLIAGKTREEIEQIYDELAYVYVNNVSRLAKSDGAECIAEVEVLLFRGEEIPDAAMNLYRKYIIK